MCAAANSDQGPIEGDVVETALWRSRSPQSMTRSRVLIASVAIALAGCASIHFDTTWKNKDSQPVPMAGKKVLVVALNVPQVVRQGIETAMANELGLDGIHGVPSFKVLDAQSTASDAKQKMEAGGFDAAFVVRLADRQDDMMMTAEGCPPADKYKTLSGGTWSTADASDFTADKKVWIEALVYSVKNDQLAWSGGTTMNNANIGAACREIARMAVVEMKRVGMIV
jgi:hypothetical protein